MASALARGCVLLSTYNGAAYLNDQLDSIFRQRGCAVHVVVRDDGSTDRTPALLRARAAARNDMQVVHGANLGVMDSFFALLRDAPPGFDGYFFSDQDDVWDPDKMQVALDVLRAGDPATPTLYCCSVRYVDEHGTALGRSLAPTAVGLGNALIECAALGCTMSLNPAALAVLRESLPARGIMHDWWSYLAIAAVGTVVHDDVPRMQYRLHANNVLGARTTWLGDLALRLSRRVRRRRGVTTRSAQAAELLRALGHRIGERDRRELIELFLEAKRSAAARLRLIGHGGLRRAKGRDQLILNLQLLLNDY